MAYIKRKRPNQGHSRIRFSIWRWLLPLTLVLSGCASLSKSDKVETPAVPAAEQGELVLIPNPYLKEQDAVPEEAKRVFQDAVTAMEQSDWASARTQLQTLTETYPQLSGPYVNLGIVLWQQNKLEQAEQAFTRAIEVNALNNDAYNQYGVLLREQGRFAEAEQLYLKALDVWPHSPATHRNLGILYDLYLGQFNKAMEHYEMAQKVSADHSQEMEGWIIDLKRRMDNS